MIKTISKKVSNVNNMVIEKIINNVPHAIFWKMWKNERLVFMGCNQKFAEQFGYTSPSGVIGKTDADFPWTEELREKYQQDDLEILRTRVPKLDYEESQVQPGGEERTLLVSKVPFYDEEGKSIGILGIYTDITQRKRLEENLRKAKEAAEAVSKAKTEFLENIRHDMRTPLTGIIGLGQLIRERLKDPQIIQYADSMLSSSNALMDLINEILEAMRISDRTLPIQKKKFSLPTLLEKVLQLHQAMVQKKGLNLELQIDKKLPAYLLGDFKRIQKILIELLSNALNFTDKGTITVKAEQARVKDNQLILRLLVKDTGIGIPAERKDQIFDSFTRLHPSYQGVYKGLGLGLTMVRQLVDDLEGEVYVESQVAKGSLFSCLIPLQLPLTEDDYGAVDDSEMALKSTKSTMLNGMSVPKKFLAATEQTAKTGKTRVLLVEDQDIAATVVIGILEKLDCQVVHAQDGESALAFAKAQNFDLIFMDVGLPDMNGCEVTRRIREWESQQDKYTPVLALTAHVETENKENCIESGMDAVLGKPLSSSTAEDMLNAFIPHRQTKRNMAPAGQTQAKPTSRPLQPIEGKVIDLALGASVVQRDESFAKKMLKMLMDSMPEEIALLDDAYQKQDWKAIVAVAHKLRGGASYCGTPRLKIVCANLENYTRGEEVESAQREKLYQQMREEIAALVQEWDRMEKMS